MRERAECFVRYELAGASWGTAVLCPYSIWISVAFANR
jgi:hypothetical protein